MSLYSTIQSKFAAAVKEGALIFTESTNYPATVKGTQLVYSLVPSLRSKPSKQDNQKEDAPKSPWLPPEDTLLVQKGPTHSVVLNKYAVTKYHFLVITTQFESQEKPLNESDWESTFEVLKQANSESGKRHVGFFNCGPESGASVAHKHVQIMTLPENFTPFVDRLPKPELKANPNGEVRPDITNSNKLPFAHFVAFLEPDMTVEDITATYFDLVMKALTVLGRDGASKSYNVVFTEEWIMLTPRSHEKTEGISINSLGTIGLILARDEQQLETIKERNWDLIRDLGYEYEPVLPFSHDEKRFIQY